MGYSKIFVEWTKWENTVFKRLILFINVSSLSYILYSGGFWGGGGGGFRGFDRTPL